MTRQELKDIGEWIDRARRKAIFGEPDGLSDMDGQEPVDTDS